MLAVAAHGVVQPRRRLEHEPALAARTRTKRASSSARGIGRAAAANLRPEPCGASASRRASSSSVERHLDVHLGSGSDERVEIVAAAAPRPPPLARPAASWPSSTTLTPRPTSGSSASREAGQTNRASTNADSLSRARRSSATASGSGSDGGREERRVVDQPGEQRHAGVLDRLHDGAIFAERVSRRPSRRPMRARETFLVMSDPAPIEPAAPPPKPRHLRCRVDPCRARRRAAVEPYRRLAEIFHDVLSEESLDALLERIADALAELIPYEDVHIYEADEAKRELIPVLARSKWADEVMSETFSFGEGITGWAVEHREPVLANKAHLDPRVRFVPGNAGRPRGAHRGAR